MDRSRIASLVLLSALAALAVIGGRAAWRSRHSPLRLAALLEEARGFALGRQVALDHPAGGLVVLLAADTGFEPDRQSDRRLRAGLQAGCGDAFEVRVHLAPLAVPDGQPDFLRQRSIGNAHLARIADVLREHPACIAVAARVDPQQPLPPAGSPRASPPLYAFGHGDASPWAAPLAKGRLRAVQLDHPAGQAAGPHRMSLAEAADTYYRVHVAN